MPLKAVWVVTTLLGFSLCAVAQDVTPQENPNAKVMHPFVMEALLHSCHKHKTEDELVQKSAQYIFQCTAFVNSLATKKDQDSGMQQCQKLFVGLKGDRRGDQEIRDHAVDGPIYVEFLEKYMKDNVPHAANQTAQPPPGSTVPGTGDSPGKRTSISWSLIFVIFVIILFGLAVWIYWVLRDYKHKMTKEEGKTAAEQAQNNQLQLENTNLRNENARLGTHRSAADTPSCLRRLIDLNNTEKLVEVCTRLKLSTDMINKVATTRSWTHIRRCGFITTECKVSEEQIIKVLDVLHPITQLPTPPQQTSLQSSPDRREGNGWGGRAGAGNGTEGGCIQIPDDNTTQHTGRMACTAPATGPDHAVNQLQHMFAGSPQASLYAPQHMIPQNLSPFHGGSLFAQPPYPGFGAPMNSLPMHMPQYAGAAWQNQTWHDHAGHHHAGHPYAGHHQAPANTTNDEVSAVTGQPSAGEKRKGPEKSMEEVPPTTRQRRKGPPPDAD